MTPRTLMRVDDVAAYIGQPTAWVRTAMADGTIPGARKVKHPGSRSRPDFSAGSRLTNQGIRVTNRAGQTPLDGETSAISRQPGETALGWWDAMHDEGAHVAWGLWAEGRP